MAKIDPKLVILEILRNSPNGINKTKLFKSFYLAHLIYADMAPGLLTDWQIARMPQGPGIHDSFKLLDELQAQGLLARDPVRDGPYQEHLFRATGKSPAIDIPKDAAEAIRKATEFVLPKTATEISNLTHEHSRSWIEGKNGELLDIYTDLIDDEDYERRDSQLAELDEVMTQVLGGNLE